MIDVVLPPGYKIERAESFLDQKIPWIKKHIRLRPAAKFIYLGKQMKVLQEFNLFVKKHHIKIEGEKLIITSPSGSAAKPETLFEIWLRNEAKKYIPLRAAAAAKTNNISFGRISIKGQRTRWGSCSSRKYLSFNYRLMKFREEVIDYVIIHELCHLKEMNHSKRFWNLVGEMCPGYKILKKELNDTSI